MVDDITTGRPSVLLEARLCSRLVHQGVDGGADLPVGSVGPNHQLEDWTLPATLRRHRWGDPRCLVTSVTGLICPPHLHPHLLITARRGRDWCLFFVFVFLFFYEEKLKSVHVCVCTWACVCVSVCVRVLTIYLSFGAKSWKMPEQANERAGSKEICERHMHWIIWSLIRARKQEDREPIRTEDYTILPPDWLILFCMEGIDGHKIGMNESRRFTLKVLCAVRYLKNYLIWDCSTNLNVTFVTFTYQKNKSQLSLFFYCKAFSSSVVFGKLELEDCAVFRVKYLKPSDYHDFYPFPLFYKSKQTKKNFWIKEENLSWVVLTGWAEVVQFWFWSHKETSAETNLQLRNHLYVKGEIYSASEPCESLQESSCLVFASVHKICAALG